MIRAGPLAGGHDGSHGRAARERVERPQLEATDGPRVRGKRRAIESSSWRTAPAALRPEGRYLVIIRPDRGRTSYLPSGRL